MDDDAVRWLRSCVWPEQRWRVELLDRAVSTARRDPPTVLAGDAVESLPELVRSVPADTAVCVVHTAVLAYLTDGARFIDSLSALARERPLWWVSGEAQGLVPALPTPATPRPADRISFLYGYMPLGAPGHPPRAVARAGAHGAWIEPLEPASSTP
jgi:hypothetical protein